MRLIAFVWLFVAAFLAFAPPAEASGHRLALVIGNSKYVNTHELSNPSNDARDIAAKLRDLGFEVIAGTDLNKIQMDSLLREFAEKLPKCPSGIILFSDKAFASSA